MMDFKKILEEVKTEVTLGIEPEGELIKNEPVAILNQRIFNEFDWEFETFDDKTLVAMLSNAKEFINSLRYIKYYPLTYSGPTEIGKTHLLKKTVKLIKKLHLHFPHKPLGYPSVIYTTWYKIMRNKEPDYLDDLEKCGVLVISEFLCENFTFENNYTTFAIDKAHMIIDSRESKPLLIDTNKLLSEIENLDVRIASRLKRNNGIFLNINPKTPKFSSRK